MNDYTLSIRDVQAILGTSDTTVSGMIKRKSLDSKLVNNKRLISVKSVDELLERKKIDPPQWLDVTFP